MSRLYAWLHSDMGQSRTKRGNQRINFQVNYGSRDNSKKMLTVDVYFPHTELPDDESEPQVIIWLKGKQIA